MNRRKRLLFPCLILLQGAVLLAGCGESQKSSLSGTRHSAGDAKLSLGLDLRMTAEAQAGEPGVWAVEVKGETSRDLGTVRFQLLLPRGWSAEGAEPDWEETLPPGTGILRSFKIHTQGESGGVLALQAFSQEQRTAREVYLGVGDGQPKPPAITGKDGQGRPVRFTTVPICR